MAKFQVGLKAARLPDVVVDEWGKRRLAYAIDCKTEGYYVLMRLHQRTGIPKELDRILGITEGVIRFP